MAAGQGFKTFTTGEVLTAGDVNGYLMQGINVFASSAARAAAITSPQEGQYSFLKDTNALEYYDGAAWVGAPVGDITAVNAGTGISGGGASGAVTITNSMATEIAAKGDLIVGTGSQTFDNLTVGANNTVLTADSSTATGLKWATAASGTFPVARYNPVTTGTFTTTSSAFVDQTGYTLTYTPVTASNKITFGFDFMYMVNTTGANVEWQVTDSISGAIYYRASAVAASGQYQNVSLQVTMSNVSVTSRTVKLQVRINGGFLYTNYNEANGWAGSQIRSLEVYA